jgi:hypothetical protein
MKNFEITNFKKKRSSKFHEKFHENKNRNFSISKFFETNFKVVITFLEIDETF